MRCNDVLRPVGLFIIAFAAAACSAAQVPASAPPTAVPTVRTELDRDIRGTLTLQGNHRETSPSVCTGHGDYLDINSGTQVILRDAQGTIVGRTTLGKGQAVNADHACRFSFVFEDVPDSAHYTVAAGDRPGSIYSREELAADEWTLALEVGR